MPIKENDVASYNGYSKRVNFIKEELSKGTTPINIVTAFNKKYDNPNIVVTDDTKKKLRNNQTLINKCYVNEMYKKLDYWQGLIDDYATRAASKVQDSMQKADATKYSIEKYKNYLTNLEYVRRMTSDRRTIKEMMQVINDKSNNPDRDFYNYVETRNNWVEVYQKKFATELKAKSISNHHIAKILNRSESYVRLLLDNTNQDKLAKGASKVPSSDASKAKKLAEKNTSVADIGKQLNITKDVAKTVHNLLGDSYMKAWAKRLADADNSVSAISAKLGKEDSWVRDTALGASYLTRWAKKLVYAGKNMNNILDTFKLEKNAANKKKIRSDLGDSFCKAWALWLLRKKTSMPTIAETLGYTDETRNKKTVTAAQILADDKILTTNSFKEIARTIADGNRKTANAIEKKIQKEVLTIYTTNYIMNSLLGPDYMISWVQALSNDKDYKNNKNKYADIQNIVNPLSEKTVKEYAEMANKPESWRSAKVNSITSSLSTLPKSDSNIEKKRKKVRDLVENVDTTMTIIRNDDNMKKYYGKSPSVEDIRTLMGGQKGAFFKNWAKRLASNGKAVSTIAEALGYGKLSSLKDTEKTNVLTEVKGTLLGNGYMKTWAQDLFNNKSNIASIATKLSISNKAAYDYVGEDAIKEKVKGMIRGSKPKTIPNIYDFLGGTKSHAYIRNKLLETEEIRLYLNRVISSKGIDMNADAIKDTIFGINKNDNDYKDYIFDMLAEYNEKTKLYKPNDVLKTWALNLRNKGKTVKEIAAHIKETKSNKNVINVTYVRDTLLGNEILKPWILTIIKDITKTADNVKDATGVPAKSLPDIIGEDAFRSWAIRLTKYYDKNAKNKLNSFYSVQEILKKLGTIKSASAKGYVEIKSDLNDSTINKKDWIKGLHTLLGKEYRIQWVLRLKDKAGLNQSQIVTKTGMDADTVEKYMAAKDLS